MVVFNALQTSLSGGIGRYSYELVKAIYILNCLPIKIIIRREDKPLFSFALDKDLIIIDGIKNGKTRNFYEQFVIPRRIYNLDKNAIIHYPDSMAPLLARNKVVITIHDLAFITRKNDLTKTTAIWKSFATRESVNKSRKIICITNFAKEETEKYYPKVSKKIDVIYNGFNNFANEKISMQEVREDIVNYASLPYILSVSTISPRKNIDGLIISFKNIMNNIPHNLIIAGGNGWFYEKIYRLVKELNIENRVFFTGKVNDEELKYLYKNSSAFVYPSFYEGFGLPPLEAMSYGIPCIASNVTSIPEVLMDSALYIDPFSIEDISEKIINLVSNEDVREKLIYKGFKRINEFSWEKCARNTIKVYESMLKED